MNSIAEKKSIRSNYIYNLINVVSSLLFPLVTFPYVTRVISADGIGQVQFYQSIISYICLLTSIGIPMYAVKEIAKVRDDYRLLSKTTIEILGLHMGLTLIGYVIVLFLCLFVSRVSESVPIFLILSLTLILSAIGCGWFFSGVEDFKFITIRALIVKSTCVVFLFCFVRSKADLYYYAAYSVLIEVGNNIWNLFRLAKYIRIKDIAISELNFFRHLTPSLHVFVINLISSIYINLDTVMLGFLTDNTSVGYYAAASKMSRIMVALVSSLGTVLLPRLSHLAGNCQEDEFKSLANKSYKFTLLVSIPITVMTIIAAPYLVSFFCGDAFVPSIRVLQLLMPITLASGLSNVFGIQILYPQNRVNCVIASASIGAVINIIFNLILIPLFQQNGAAVASSFAEICVTLSMFILAKRYLPLTYINSDIIKYLFATVFIAVLSIFLLKFKVSTLVLLVILFVVSSLLYFALLILLKESITKSVLCRIHNFLQHRE